MTTMLIRTAAALLLTAGTASAAFAQATAPAPAPSPAAGHHGTSMPMAAGAAAAAKPAMGANHQEMMAAMDRMNKAMMAPNTMTGDPDRDFVASMTPHHQGAIDMARLYLREGKDPAIRKMAQKIIVDQEREIRDFQRWQGKHPAK